MAKITTTFFGDLAILPHPAEAPIKETLEFLTDVLQSYNGKEQRLQLRTKARQMFAYKIPLQAWNIAAASNTAYGAISKKWAIPIWSEAQFIGNVAEAASTIACDAVFYDLRANSLAMLFAGYDNWQIVEISSIASNSISVSNSLVEMSGAWLLPIRIGFISGSIDKPTNGHNGRVELNFEIEDNLELLPTAPAQYLSKDVYYDVPLMSGGESSNAYSKRVDIVDYALGPVHRRSPWLNSRYARPYFFQTNKRSEIYEFRKFVYRRVGKFREFLLPSHEVDLRVRNTGIITTTLVVDSDNFFDYSSERTNIAIQHIDGSWLLRSISNPIQITADRLQFTLSSAINLLPSNIARISYLGNYRLEADRIEISWSNGGLMESELRILEIAP